MMTFNEGPRGRSKVKVNTDDYLTSSQVAAIVGYSPTWIGTLIAREQFPKPTKMMGRTYLWLKKDIFEWLSRKINKC